MGLAAVAPDLLRNDLQLGKALAHRLAAKAGLSNESFKMFQYGAPEACLWHLRPACGLLMLPGASHRLLI